MSGFVTMDVPIRVGGRRRAQAWVHVCRALALVIGIERAGRLAMWGAARLIRVEVGR